MAGLDISSLKPVGSSATTEAAPAGTLDISKLRPYGTPSAAAPAPAEQQTSLGEDVGFGFSRLATWVPHTVEFAADVPQHIGALAEAAAKETPGAVTSENPEAAVRFDQFARSALGAPDFTKYPSQGYDPATLKEAYAKFIAQPENAEMSARYTEQQKAQTPVAYQVPMLGSDVVAPALGKAAEGVKDATGVDINAMFPEAKNAKQQIIEGVVEGAVTGGTSLPRLAAKTVLGTAKKVGEAEANALRRQVMSDLLMGGVGGATGTIAAQNAPEGWEMPAGLIGGIAGGVGAHVAGAGAAKVAGKVGDYLRPAIPTKGNVERMAGEALRGAATDPDAAISAMRSATAPEGVEFTAGQASQDTGLLNLEQTLARGKDQKFREAMVDRAREQNAALAENVRKLEEGGASPAATAAFYSDRMSQLQARMEQLEEHSAQLAKMHADGLEVPDAADVGGRLQDAIAGEKTRVKDEIAALDKAIDPSGDMRLPTGELRNRMASIYNDMSPEERLSLTPEERSLLGIIRGYGATIPYDRFRSLRTQLNEDMRNAQGNGKGRAYGRLSQLRGALEADIEAAINQRLTEKTGAANEFVRDARDWYETHVNRAAGPAAGAGAVGSPGAAPRGGAEASGAESAPVGEPGETAGGAGLPDDAEARRAVEGGGRYEQKGVASPYRVNIPDFRGGASLAKITKTLKGMSSDKSIRSFRNSLAKYDTPEEALDNLYWHGTGGYVAGGLKAGSTLPEDAFRSGGYGEMQNTISLSKSKEVASNFTGDSRSGSVIPVALKRDATVEAHPEWTDAMEVEDALPDLWDRGVDAVRIGDWNAPHSEKELVVLNPRALARGHAEHFSVFQKKRFEEPTIDDVTQMMAERADDGAAFEQSAHAAATSPLNDLPEPTQAQKEAGNYKKGHIKLGGLDISVENPAGSKRSGKDASGRPWSVEMKDHYGYIKGTVGRDKDHLDVFVAKGTENLTDNSPAFVVDQVDPRTGKLDEHKIMLGYPDKAAAEAAYRSNYAKGWKGLGAITPTTVGRLKDWIKTGETKGRFDKAGFDGSPSIADTMAERFAAAGRPEKEAKAAGQLVDAFYTTLAKRAGKSVDDIQAIAPLPRVEKGGAEGGLQQAAQRQTESPEFRRWFGSSKVVNADGAPMVVYRGSKTIGADRFDPNRRTEKTRGTGVWFSSDRGAAGSFAGADGEVYPVYLSLKNPVVVEWNGHWTDGPETAEYRVMDKKGVWHGRASFDTEAQARAYAKSEGLSGFDIEPVYGSEGRTTDEFVRRMREKHPDADGIILKNVAGGGEGAGGFADMVRGDEYVAFEPTQIKSAIGNRGTFDPNDPSILNQSRKADESRDLYAVHNIKPGGVLNADKIGGLPMPSLAVAHIGKGDFGNFGDISLVGSPKLVDPKGGAGAKTYDADVYSPRYPSITHDVDDRAFGALNKPLVADIKEYGGSAHDGIDLSRLEDRGPGDALDATGLKLAYLKERGKAPEIARKADGSVDWYTNRERIDSALRGDERAAYEDWARSKLEPLVKRERIFKGFDYNGNRRYREHNIDNVLSDMRARLKEGEGFMYGVGTIRSKHAKQFRSLDAIRKEKDRLTGTGEMQGTKDEFGDRFFALADEMKPYYRFEANSFGYADDVASMFGDMAKKGQRALDEGFKDLPPAIRVKISDYLHDLKNAPTEYFETKINRNVGLNEFEAALVPTGTQPRVIEALKKAGLKIVEYDKSQPNARTEAIKKLNAERSPDDGLLFQGEQGPRGSILLGRNGAPSLIKLFEKADASTAVHESAHQFLDMFQRVAGDKAAPEALRKDWAATRAWWEKNAAQVAKDAGEGVTAADVRKVLRDSWVDGDKGRAIAKGMHEQWSRAFEVYLRDGVAPNAAMKGVFEQFKDWLSQVYRSITGMNVNVSKDIRGVFDRMLGAEQGAPASGNLIDRAAAGRLKDVTGRWKDYYSTYSDKSAGPVPQIVKKSKGETYPFDMPAENVVRAAWRRGPEGAAAIRNMLKAAGSRADDVRKGIEDAAVLSMTREAMKDGVVDPDLLSKWRAKHSDALGAVPALDGKMQTAANATAEMRRIAKVHADARKDIERTAVGSILKLGPSASDADVARAVGGMLGKQDSVRAMRDLVSAASGDANALSGLRSAVADYALSRFVRDDKLSAAGIKRWLSQNQAAIKEVLTPEQMNTLRAVIEASDKISNIVRAPGGGSPTAEYLMALEKRNGGKEPSMMQAILSHAIANAIQSGLAGVAGHLAGGLGLGLNSALGFFVSKSGLDALRARGLIKVEDLMKEAILDKELGAALMMRAAKRKGEGSAAKLERIIGNGLIGAIAGNKERDERQPDLPPERKVRPPIQPGTVTPMLGIRG